MDLPFPELEPKYKPDMNINEFQKQKETTELALHLALGSFCYETFFVGHQPSFDHNYVKQICKSLTHEVLECFKSKKDFIFNMNKTILIISVNDDSNKHYIHVMVTEKEYYFRCFTSEDPLYELIIKLINQDKKESLLNIQHPSPIISALANANITDTGWKIDRLGV